MTGKIGSGQMTGKSAASAGRDNEAIESISIVAGELIVVKRSGESTNLGKTVVQELFSDTITVPVGDGEVELTHNLNTKNVMFQVFDANDDQVIIPTVRELNKIKFFFGPTDTEATYTVVIAQ